MVIYKETVFVITLVIALLVVFWLTVRNERGQRGDIPVQENTANPAGENDSLSNYVKEHYPRSTSWSKQIM